MSTITTLAHYASNVQATASMPASPAVAASGKADGDGDRGVESIGGSQGQGVSNNLTHAVQQAISHLHGQAKTGASDNTGMPGQGMPPTTMQGFIQALVASLHQIGINHAVQQPQAMQSGLQAVSADSGRYAPVAVNDVQSMIQQSATVLSSNTALQQDFQSMLRAAGIDPSATSLSQFLRSVSSQMKPSSVISAIA